MVESVRKDGLGLKQLPLEIFLFLVLLPQIFKTFVHTLLTLVWGSRVSSFILYERLVLVTPCMLSDGSVTLSNFEDSSQRGAVRCADSAPGPAKSILFGIEQKRGPTNAEFFF